MITQVYKQTQRPQRQIATEQTFNKGMFYKNTAIPEGYSRLLVNLDIDKDTGTLKPRRGLTSGPVTVSTADTPTSINGVTMSGVIHQAFKHTVLAPEYYTAGVWQGSKRLTDFLQLIVGNNGSDNKAWACRIRKDNMSQYPATQLAVDRVINDTLYTGFVRYAGLLAANSKIYGKAINPNVFTKTVGCQAFNKNYYYFQRLVSDPDPITGMTHTLSRLSYTKYKQDVLSEELPNRFVVGPADGYDAFEVTPYTPTPSEAASWGVNMLLDNPYTFECVDGATIIITGMLPYDAATNEPLLTPRRGQILKMKGYYRAPEEFHSATEATVVLATINAGTAATFSDLPTPSALVANGTYYAVTELNANYIYYNHRWNYYNDLPGTVPASVSVVPDDSAEDAVRVVWEWREVGSSNWTTFKDTTVLLSEQNYTPFEAEFTVPTRNVLVRLTITDPKDITKTITGESVEYVLSTNTTGVTVLTEETANNLNLKPVKYDLGSAQGMLEWEQRLVLWGVEGAENMLFVSDVNNPSYFPYPNNVDIFKEAVINVITHGRDLIVFTNNSIYKLAWSNNGASWVKTILQQNLQYNIEDRVFTLSVKGMLFYKQGNYFYMLVPKTVANTDELTVAPISNSIKGFLDDIWNNLDQILKETYPDRATPFIGRTYQTVSQETVISKTLSGAGSYVDGTDIVVWFQHTLDAGLVYTELRYNIDTRTWRTYVYDTSTALVNLRHLGLYQVGYDPNTQSQTQEEEITHVAYIKNERVGASLTYAFQFYKKKPNVVKDEGYVKITDAAPNVFPSIVYNAYTHTLPNYQLFDTGVREFNGVVKSRFRELQFSIMNHSNQALTLLNEIYVDGVKRKTPYKQEPRFDEDTKEVVIDEVLENSTRIAGDTTINPPSYVPEGETPVDTFDESLPYWELGFSNFPNNNSWKIRIPYSGKGYTTRTVLKSLNEKDYEILNLSWVYRAMNAR